MAASVDYEATVTGQYIVIAEKKELFSPKVIALRKSIITSVHLEGQIVVVRTSEIDLSYEPKDKEKRTRTSHAIYKFVNEDDKDARKPFDFILVESGS